MDKLNQKACTHPGRFDTCLPCSSTLIKESVPLSISDFKLKVKLSGVKCRAKDMNKWDYDEFHHFKVEVKLVRSYRSPILKQESHTTTKLSVSEKGESIEDATRKGLEKISQKIEDCAESMKNKEEAKKEVQDKLQKGIERANLQGIEKAEKVFDE